MMIVKINDYIINLEHITKLSNIRGSGKNTYFKIIYSNGNTDKITLNNTCGSITYLNEFHKAIEMALINTGVTILMSSKALIKIDYEE